MARALKVTRLPEHTLVLSVDTETEGTTRLFTTIVMVSERTTAREAQNALLVI
jgi:hypothetical protein